MKKVQKFVVQGLEQWFDNPNFGYLPLDEFKANGLTPGFNVARIERVMCSPSKSSYGHGNNRLCWSESEAIKEFASRLERQGEKGKFALKTSNGYLYFTL